MSSVKLSVSGERGYSLSVAPEATSLWAPTKQGDEVRATFSSLGTAKMVLPRNARIERMASGEAPNRHEYLVLVIPAQAGLTVQGFKADDDTSWPHVEVDVRRNQPDTFFARLEPAGDPFDVATLFSDDS